MNTAPLQVLLAEDNPAHVEAIRRAFETAGMKVNLRAVATLREYRACLADWTPNLALVDLNLPDGRAVELLTYPPEDAAFPVLVMTAFGSQEIVVEVIKAGAMDYVVKSRDAFAAMPHTVERVFREWQLLQGHKQVDAALKKNEAKYGKMLANIGDVIVIIDQSGINRYKSSSLERLFGWRPEEVVGAPALDNVHPEDLDHAREVIGSLFQEPHAAGQIECRYRCKDGRYKWIKFSGVNLVHDPDIRGVLGNYHDITERKRVEAVMQESEAKYRSLVETTGTGYLILDGNGRVLDANPEYVRLSGHRELREIVGRNVLEWTADAERERTAQAVASCARSGIIRNLTIDYVDGAGRVTPVEINATAEGKDADLRIVSLCRDITERKKAEAEHEKLQAQYAHAQKMESVGRLAGGVAHDFNNLLMGIMNYAELCRDQIAPDHPIRKYIDELTRDARRSAEITRQLLAFASKQTIAPMVIDLNDAVAGMLNLLRRLIGEDIKLAWRPGIHLRPVRLDPSQVDQLLVNLCVNARDAIAGVGEITLETGSLTADAAYCARHLEAIPGSYVFLAVTDNGCGMDPETLAQVFEPFFTTKGVGKGTGLGLAMVYGIVKQHNGFVCATSEPGKGTTFTICLPEIAAEPVEAPVPRKTASPRGRGETILLVEDEKSIRVTCGEFLDTLGYKVLIAETPGEALKRLAAHPGEIHLLLTDVIMPEMDGKQLSERISALKPDIRVVFMSGYTNDVVSSRSGLDEGVHFLEKPFSRDDLARKVRQVLDSASAQTR